jgi:DNA-binding NtrC family response regulator
LAQISAIVKGSAPSIVLLAFGNDDETGRAVEFFNLARCEKWNVPITALCVGRKPGDAEALFRLGAAGVFSSLAEVGPGVHQLLVAQHSIEESPTIAGLRGRLGLAQIVGESPYLLSVLKEVPIIARYDACVLILGETGTGKEVFARAIHYHSTRSAKPFVPVNCGAVPVELLENEFFGHESGAFTSASSSRQGVLQEAHGGTLFLDEVDCLPLLAQVKLLRFLQDGQFRRLGSERTSKVDVRVIAASNIDLSAAQEAGRFRKDLYYRLNVISLNLPPLREREGDIILLAEHFLQKYAAKFGASAREFSPQAMQKLLSHKWPGNVRELENVVQRAVVLAKESIVQMDEVCTSSAHKLDEPQTFQYLKARAIEDFERNYLRHILAINRGNITKAAKSAGKDRRAFWQLMRKHQISPRVPPPGVSPL